MYAEDVDAGVASCLCNSMRKLGASTRFEAVVAARRQGLLPWVPTHAPTPSNRPSLSRTVRA
jgi:hypothetical protein